MKHSLSRGFTLIEILVVMLIIAVLATIGAGSFQSSQQKGRDARRKSDLKQISVALEAYFNDTGQYPLSSAQGEIMGCDQEQVCGWGEGFINDAGTVYMVELPLDPSRGSASHYYYHSPTGSWFQLYARLENEYDRDILVDANNSPLGFDQTVCGINDQAVCNYGISSVNTTPTEGRALVEL